MVELNDQTRPVDGIGSTPNTSTEDKPSTSVTEATSARIKMSKYIYIIIAALMLTIGGLSAWMYYNSLQQAEENGAKDQQVSLLQINNAQLRDKVARQKQAAVEVAAIRSQHNDRVEAERELGCEQLDDILPLCITRIRQGLYEDYLKVARPNE